MLLQVSGHASHVILHAARVVSLVRCLVELVALLGALGYLTAVAYPVTVLGGVPRCPLHVAVIGVLQIYSQHLAVQITSSALAIVDNAPGQALVARAHDAKIGTRLALHPI